MSEQLRAAAQAALEALTCDDGLSHRCGHCDDYVDRNSVVRDQLRTALAQPERPAGKPGSLGRWNVTDGGRTLCSDDFEHDARLDLDGDFEDAAQRIQYAQALCDRLNGQPEQPAGKPVAWQERQAMHARKDGFVVRWSDWYSCIARLPDAPLSAKIRGIPYEWRPLYAAPPPARLTDGRVHPELSMDPDGDISLDWSLPGGGLLSIGISPSGKACYAMDFQGVACSGGFEVAPQAHQFLAALRQIGGEG